jgi:hypothetical protein
MGPKLAEKGNIKASKDGSTSVAGVMSFSFVTNLEWLLLLGSWNRNYPGLFLMTAGNSGKGDAEAKIEVKGAVKRKGANHAQFSYHSVAVLLPMVVAVGAIFGKHFLYREGGPRTLVFFHLVDTTTFGQFDQSALFPAGSTPQPPELGGSTTDVGRQGERKPGSARGPFPKGCKWRDIQYEGHKKGFWDVEQYEYWDEALEEWTATQPAACTVKGLKKKGSWQWKHGTPRTEVDCKTYHCNYEHLWYNNGRFYLLVDGPKTVVRKQFQVPSKTLPRYVPVTGLVNRGLNGLLKCAGAVEDDTQPRPECSPRRQCDSFCGGNRRPSCVGRHTYF